MRVLVIRYRKLGDALMVTPVLRALHETGRYDMATVTEAFTEPIFTRMPGVAGNVRVPSEQPSRVDMIRAGLRARRFRPEAALVFSFRRRASVLAMVAGCRERYGAGEQRLRDVGCLTRNVYDPANWGDLHQVERYYAIADAMAGPLPRHPTTFHVPETEARAARERLGPLPREYAAVHLGGGGSNLGPSDEVYARIIEDYRARGLSVVAAGGKDAEGFTRSRAAADADFVGRTDLDALAELHRGARFVAGLDGGGTQVAAAVGTPVVCLSLSLRWSVPQVTPYRARAIMIGPEAHCPGCSLHHCRKQGRVCVETLRPERVVEAGLRLWEETA